MVATFSGATRFPPPRRRLRLGFVGGGRGSFIGEVHAMGARMSNRFEAVAAALSSDPQVARESGRDWLIPEDRIYADWREMVAREAARPDGIEAVAISTPNDSHHAICAAFMDKGVDIICDKPLTTSLADSLDLVARQRKTGLVFGVTHAYAAHAMMRQAREMIAAGELGRLRQIHVEYIQDHGTPPPRPDQKGLLWRMDPKKVGPAATTGDIGTHCHHLASFVTGLELTKLRAEFHVCGAPKPLEDTAFMHVRYAGDVPGTIFVTQAAPGNACGLRLRIYGEKAGLEWEQIYPEELRFNRLGEPQQTILRGHGAGILPSAARVIRMPRGHGEALSDAWCNLYTELAIAIEARRDGRKIEPGLLAYPTVEDGARGVKFIEAAVESNRQGGAWIDCRLAP